MSATNAWKNCSRTDLAEERAAEEEAAKVKTTICDELAELLEEERPDWFREEVGALRRRWQESGRAGRDQYKALDQRWKELNDRFEAAALAENNKRFRAHESPPRSQMLKYFSGMAH